MEIGKFYKLELSFSFLESRFTSTSLGSPCKLLSKVLGLH